MIKSCPEPVENTELNFILKCRLKVSPYRDFSKLAKCGNLLACSSRYGLLFSATTSNCFQVIQTKTFDGCNREENRLKNQEVEDYPRRNIQIPSVAKHLSVNCDGSIIAVVLEKDQCPVVIFFEIQSFFRKDVKIIREARLSSSPNVYARDVNWNPSLPAIFTACKSDGSLGVYELKENSLNIVELPAASGATCFCWSPKGKQIAVGSRDGKITQYKPDLKAVKVIAEPKLEEPHKVLGLQWVSNYQFIGIYESIKDSSCCFIVVDAPKTGDPTYINYSDICFSGSFRPAQFYMIFQQSWNLLMVASANSTELSVLGTNGESWIQWIMTDNERAELPFTKNSDETLPIGLALDTSSTTPLTREESTLPPPPVLCILSHYGVLHCFNVVYMKEGIPLICTPPDNVADLSGLSDFVTTPGNTEKQAIAEKPKAIVLGDNHVKQKTSNSTISNNGFKQPTLSSNVLNQNVPAVAEKNSTELSNQLFEGRPSLTPIKPPQANSGTLFGGQTLITPINKGLNKINSLGNQISGNDNYKSIFASLNPTSQLQTCSTPVKPILISTISEKPDVATSKLNNNGSLDMHQKNEEIIVIKTPTQIEPRKPRTVLKQDEATAVSKTKRTAITYQMINTEYASLEKEMTALVGMGLKDKDAFQTGKEIMSYIERTESLQEFFKDAEETSSGQTSEVQCLKQSLMESWNIFQEAKSRLEISKNDALAGLAKTQPLDSLAQRRAKDIEWLVFYVDSQYAQTTRMLDEQWDAFQDFAKESEESALPSMETIFKTIVNQNGILQKQTYVMKDITTRIKNLNSNLNLMLLCSEKNRDLADDFQNLQLVSRPSINKRYEEAKKMEKYFTKPKVEKLSKLLKSMNVRKANTYQTLSFDDSSGTESNYSQSSSIETPVDQDAAAELNSSDKSAFSVPGANPMSFISLLKRAPVISTPQGSAFTPINTFYASSMPAMSSNQLFSVSESETSLDKPQLNLLQNSTVAISEPLTLRSPVSRTLFASASDTEVNKLQTISEKSTFRFSTGATPISLNDSNFNSTILSNNSLTQQMSFGGTPKITTSTTEHVSKPNDGTIFANLQSVIDKATTSVSNISFKQNSPSTDFINSAVKNQNLNQGLVSSMEVRKNVSEPVFKFASEATPTSTTFVFDSSALQASVKPFPAATFTSTTASIFGPVLSTSSPNFVSNAVSFGNPIKLENDINIENKVSEIPTSNVTETAKTDLTPKQNPESILSINEQTMNVTSAITNVIEVGKFSFAPSKEDQSDNNQVTRQTTSKQSIPLSASSLNAEDALNSVSERNVDGTSQPPAQEPVTTASGILSSTQETKTAATGIYFMFGTSKQSGIFGNSTLPPSSVTTSPVIFSNTSPPKENQKAAPDTSAKNIFLSSPIIQETVSAPIVTAPSIGLEKPKGSTTTVETFQHPTFGTAGRSGSIFSNTVTSNTKGDTILGSTKTLKSDNEANSNTLLKGSTTCVSEAGIFSTPNTSSVTKDLLGSGPETPKTTSIFDNSTATTVSMANIFRNSSAFATEPPTKAFPTTNVFSVASSTENIFASESTSKPVFGSPKTTLIAPFSVTPTSTTATNYFGNATTSISSTSQSNPMFSGSTTSSPKFGQTFGASPTTAIPVFGTTQTATAPVFRTTQTTAAPIFGAAQTSAAPIFGATQTTVAPVFGANQTTSASVFGATQTTAAPVFGATQTTAAPVFGATQTTAAPVFGATPTTAAPVFGATQTTAAPVFGATQTTAAPVFGATQTTAAPVFGATQTTTTPVFGAARSTAAPVFGATQTTAAPVFGFTQTTAAPVFGTTQTTAAPVFGGSQTTTVPVFGTTQTTAAPVFGTTQTTAAPVFGQTSVFGASSTTGSIFATAKTASEPSGNIFGNQGNSNAASSNGFPTTSAPSAFGAEATQSSVNGFGFGSLNVGGSSSCTNIFANSSGNSFGQANAANPFSKIEAKPGFASSTSNIFGNSATTTVSANAFGGSTTTSSSVFKTSSGNIFGGSVNGNAFGSSNIFGGSSFGQKSNGNQAPTFGGSSFGNSQGAFSSNTGSVSQNGFGSSTTFEKSGSGFGAAPIFGGPPVPPAFGSSPSFGSAAAFGSPGKIFGSEQLSSGGFPVAAQEGSGFGNIASQDTIGFGSLAQKSDTSSDARYSGSGSGWSADESSLDDLEEDPKRSFSECNYSDNDFDISIKKRPASKYYEDNEDSRKKRRTV